MVFEEVLAVSLQLNMFSVEGSTAVGLAKGEGAHNNIVTVQRLLARRSWTTSRRDS